MTFWLDWQLFGNGHGMASPYFDDVFYWLDGRFYRWSGGFGAQLHSIEWRTPAIGTRRKLFGHEFIVFSARRYWLRVEVAWASVAPIRNVSDIGALETDLKMWGHGR